MKKERAIDLRALALDPEQVRAFMNNYEVEDDDDEYEGVDTQGSAILEFINSRKMLLEQQSEDNMDAIWDWLDELEYDYDDELSTLIDCRNEIDKLIEKCKKYIEMINVCKDIVEPYYEEDDE